MAENNIIKIRDLSFGERQEEYKLPILQCLFGNDLDSTKEKYGKSFEFDYFDEHCFIEMKSRRINFGHYPTLMFGKNKLIKGDQLLDENPNLRIFYIWNCLDCLVFWEHRSSPYTIRISGRCDRGRDEFSECIHIENQYIKKLKKKHLKNK